MRCVKSLSFAAAFVAATAVSIGQSEAGPFSPLAGSWVGSGTLTVSGARERIRCRAIYFVSARGDSLRQILRCASDSYIIDVNSDVTEIDGRVSGTWHEASSGVTGTLTGVVRGAVIRGIVSGLGFEAPLSIITHGRSQYATISLGGPTIAGVAVNFHRL
jgi:hypothetical protein